MSGKGIFSLIIGILGWILFTVLPNSDWKKLFIGAALAGFLEFLGYLYESRKHLKMLTLQVVGRNKKIRITTAYLFRIEENGMFLLIKRHKKDMEGYQPVGGAYKYFQEENRELFDKLGIEPCTKVPRDEDTENDLRLVIAKRRKLKDYLTWFASKKDREIDPRREFYEELIEPGYLPEPAFRHFKYTYVTKHEEFEIPSKHLDIDEFRYADIFRLRLETDEQRQAIKALTTRPGDEIIFATAEEIRNGRTQNGKVILPHSFKILPK